MCTTNTLIAYFVCAVLYAFICAGFGMNLGRNPKLVEIIKRNAMAEINSYVEKAKATPGAAKDIVVKNATAQATSLVEGAKAGDVALEDAGSAVEDALKNVAAGSVDDVKNYLEGQLKNTKLYGIFDICRFCVAETAVLIGLLAPSFGCGAVNTWAHVQAVFGSTGSFLTIAILAWCSLQMALDESGMYKYFPGSQSNKLYELITGVKVRAILPDRGQKSGTMRINWTTKYILMACGVSLGVGLFIQFLAAVFVTAKVFCDDESDDASSHCGEPVQAWTSWFAAVSAKAPEIVMYQMLWGTMVSDFCFACLGFLPWCCCLRRGYDEDDKLELCSCGGLLSCFSTRHTPPPVKRCGISNACAIGIEKIYFAFYQWFYMFIDRPPNGFKRCGPLIIPPPCGIAWHLVWEEYREGLSFERQLKGEGGPITEEDFEEIKNKDLGTFVEPDKTEGEWKVAGAFGIMFAIGLLSV